MTFSDMVVTIAFVLFLLWLNDPEHLAAIEQWLRGLFS